jgi:hypothetical protein
MVRSVVTPWPLAGLELPVCCNGKTIHSSESRAKAILQRHLKANAGRFLECWAFGALGKRFAPSKPQSILLGIEFF